MRTALKVTAKGQVTLRRELLRHLGVSCGDKVAVELLPGGRIELRSVSSLGSIDQFIGSLERPGTKVLSIAEIGELTAKGWIGR